MKAESANRGEGSRGGFERFPITLGIAAAVGLVLPVMVFVAVLVVRWVGG